MTKKLFDELAVIEINRGMSGVLDEISKFAHQCGYDAGLCGDSDSAMEYRRYAKKIKALSLEVE